MATKHAGKAEVQRAYLLAMITTQRAEARKEATRLGVLGHTLAADALRGMCAGYDSADWLNGPRPPSVADMNHAQGTLYGALQVAVEIKHAVPAPTVPAQGKGPCTVCGIQDCVGLARGMAPDHTPAPQAALPTTKAGVEAEIRRLLNG